MLHRVAVIGSLLLGLASFALAQFNPNESRSLDEPALRHGASARIDDGAQSVVSGAVRAQDDSGVINARIEVHDMTGTLVGSTYSGPNGNFQISNLRTGLYEVVATVGISEARQRMMLDHGNNQVVLRVSTNAPTQAAAGTSTSVSVADMRVPDKARKALNKARELLAKHRTADAEKELSRALEICPQYSEALRERGVMRFAAGQVEDAKADLEQAIKYDPNNALAYLALGAAFNNEDKFEDAARMLDRGLSLAPNAWQGYFEMSRNKLGKGDFAEALRYIDKAQQFLDIEYTPLHLVRAHALLGLKNYAEAQNELEAYIQRDPNAENAAKVRHTLDEVKAFTARASNGK